MSLIDKLYICKHKYIIEDDNITNIQHFKNEHLYPNDITTSMINSIYQIVEENLNDNTLKLLCVYPIFASDIRTISKDVLLNDFTPAFPWHKNLIEINKWLG